MNSCSNQQKTSSKDTRKYESILISVWGNLILKLVSKIWFQVEHDYSSSDFNDLDPTFNDGIKSKMLFLDYDIASKLNFFDDLSFLSELEYLSWDRELSGMKLFLSAELDINYL